MLHLFAARGKTTPSAFGYTRPAEMEAGAIPPQTAQQSYSHPTSGRTEDLKMIPSEDVGYNKPTEMESGAPEASAAPEWAQSNRHSNESNNPSFFVCLYRGIKRKPYELVAVALMCVVYGLVIGMIACAASNNVYFNKADKQKNTQWPYDDGCFGKDCDSPHCPCTSAGFTKQFFDILLPFIIFAVISTLWTLVRACYILRLLGTATPHNVSQSILKSCSEQKPLIQEHVHCYHTTGSGDDESTWTKHKEGVNFEYDICEDRTNLSTDSPDHFSHRAIVLLQPIVLVGYADAYTTSLHNSFVASFRSRHMHCDHDRTFTSGITLPSLPCNFRGQPSSFLSYGSGAADSMNQLKYWFLLSCVLGYSSLYTLWMAGSTDTQTIIISKIVTCHETVVQGTAVYAEASAPPVQGTVMVKGTVIAYE